MKKIIALCMSAVMALTLVACDSPSNDKPSAEEASAEAGLANPWSDWDTRKDAEDAAGFPLNLPRTIENTYTTTGFRTMEGDSPILEVTYTDAEFTVIVRKSPGEGRDISGVYADENCKQVEQWNGTEITYVYPTKDSNELVVILDHEGYSWSLYAPNGFWGDSFYGFITGIYEQ